MNNQTSLFLSQSYKDAWDDYNRSLTNAAFTCWDYVVLTASNEQQANGFRAQLEERLQAGFLPERTKFIVVPDDGGIRVGSGGATLGVIKRIIEERGTSDFSGLRILTVHSGGDSKRVPQYSAMGKLFSPVPRVLPNGKPTVAFVQRREAHLLDAIRPGSRVRCTINPADFDRARIKELLPST